jgi:hypothetical protein
MTAICLELIKSLSVKIRFACIMKRKIAFVLAFPILKEMISLLGTLRVKILSDIHHVRLADVDLF